MKACTCVKELLLQTKGSDEAVSGVPLSKELYCKDSWHILNVTAVGKMDVVMKCNIGWQEVDWWLFDDIVELFLH